MHMNLTRSKKGTKPVSSVGKVNVVSRVAQRASTSIQLSADDKLKKSKVIIENTRDEIQSSSALTSATTSRLRF